MEQLPIELSHEICKFMTLKEISNFSLVNKNFYQLVNSNSFYSFCKRHFCTDDKKFITALMKNTKHFSQFYRLYWNQKKYDHYRFFFQACCDGYLEIAQWLKKKYSRQINAHKKEAFVLVKSCRDLKVLLWLREVYPEIIFFEKNMRVLFFRAACERGDLEIAMWYEKTYRDLSDITLGGTVFSNACVRGHLDVAKWLFSCCPSVNIRENDEYLFQRVCANGHLEVAKWLIEICPTIDVSVNNNNIFKDACKRGKLDIAMWLFDTFPQINVKEVQYSAYINACNKGHLEVIKWLRKTNQIFDIYELDLLSFINACMDGYLDVAIYLKELNPRVIHSISLTNNCDCDIFLSVCKRGNLKMAKWLLENFPQIKDKLCHTDADENQSEINDKENQREIDVVFRDVCKRSDLEMAQWLLKTFPNIHITL